MSSDMQATEVNANAGTETGFVQLLRRYPLISYFAMAYAVSWFYVIVFEILWPLPDTIVTDVPVLFGPVVAGFVMTAVTSGRPGVRQLLHRLVLWRVEPRWYLLPVVGIPALYLLGLALVPGALNSPSLPLDTLLLLPLYFVVILVTGGPLLEEPGWRGFALPRLQRRWGPLVGTLILGCLWAGWHAPQYFTPTFAATNGGLTVSGAAVFLVGAVSFSLIITWAFNHTKASLVIAILIHQSINFTQALTTNIFPGANNNEVGPVVAFGLAALVIVVATRGRLGYTPVEREPTPAWTQRVP